MKLSTRIPISGIGIAAGLLFAGIAVAAPTQPQEASFVGDAGAVHRQKSAEGAGVIKAQQDARRWGGGASSSDQAPEVFIKGDKSALLKGLPHVGDPGQPTPQDVVNQLNAYVASLKAKGDSASLAEAKRIEDHINTMVPPNQRNVVAGDVHPVIFKEWLASLPDDKQAINPKKNTITIVDQDKLKDLLKDPTKLPTPQYRYTTITIITHHLIPTFKEVYTQYPV